MAVCCSLLLSARSPWSWVFSECAHFGSKEPFRRFFRHFLRATQPLRLPHLPLKLLFSQEHNYLNNLRLRLDLRASHSLEFCLTFSSTDWQIVRFYMSHNFPPAALCLLPIDVSSSKKVMLNVCLRSESVRSFFHFLNFLKCSDWTLSMCTFFWCCTKLSFLVNFSSHSVQ